MIMVRRTSPQAAAPEMELLILCGRVSPTDEARERIKELLLRGDVDWEYLPSIAEEHGMVPLLYHNLSSEFPELIPAAALQSLKEIYHRNTLRNLLLAGELLSVLSLLEEHGIPAIPYKGPVLAAAVYGSLSLRKAGDLDLQLHRRHVNRAVELLRTRGYSPRFQLTEAQEKAFLRFEREYGVTHDRLLVDVELQWRFMPVQFPFPLRAGDLEDRLQTVSLSGGPVQTFAPEDLLLILCVHGAKHFWERLYWICDAAELIDANRGMDWERLMELSRATGSERMLHLGLFLAQDLLGASLPGHIRQRVISDPSVEELAREVYARLLDSSGDQPRGMLEGSEFHPFHFRLRGHLRDRLHYWVRTVITPNHADWFDLPLPVPLHFLYYLLRPARLLCKYGARLAR